jgi:uncharacterized repeat protein (TIGR01451 family)
VRKAYKLSLVIHIVLLLVLMPAPERVYARWPPFSFSLTPSYDNGKITYRIEFRSRVDWAMTDVTIKIPLPGGTRFLEASAQSTTSVDFDGAEVTFFTSFLHDPYKPDRYRPIGTASFVVEVTDPTMTVFTTHAWIAWQGDQPGDYLTKDVSIDITSTRQPLNWEAPSKSSLQLEARATVADDVITYTIYPQNAGGRRVWDLKINVAIPKGTTFLSAEAPLPFVTNFDGREVSFSIVELEQNVETGPLSFKVSTEGVTDPFVVTHAWAVWKNFRRSVAEGQTRTGDIIVQPHASQRVVSDMIGDVPFSNYDLTSIALQGDGPALKIIFHTVGELGPVGEPLEYKLHIDNDCRTDTGKSEEGRGVEYLVRYKHSKGQAFIYFWDEEEKSWSNYERIEVNSPAGGKMVTVWVPYDLLEDGRQFCWVGEARNRTKAFKPNPPTEQVPNKVNLRLTQYAVVATATEIDTSAAGLSAGDFINVGDVWQYLPGWSEPPPIWKTIGFDDSDWFSGPTGIGDGDHATDLSLITRPAQEYDTSILVQRTITQSRMILALPPSDDYYGSIFMRRAFTATQPASLTQLTLKIDYQDGFVAYLNGVEVARRGLGASGSPVSYDTLATDHEADTPEVIDLSDHITDLVTGTNVLAVQIHRSLGDSDLFIALKLTWNNYPWNREPADLAPDDSDVPVPVPSVAPSDTDISGKLAVPLNSDWALYDVHVFSLPDGEEITQIPNARQPNFRFDGQRMLINREGGAAENVVEYNLADGTEKQVSDAPKDSHPFYDPSGTRVVYGNPELTPHDDDYRICVQCSLLPPHQETEPRCQDIKKLGMLVSAGLRDEIWGYHPVWTTNDMIAYRGCNSWMIRPTSCGIYIVSSTSTRGFSDGFIPRQLTHDTSDIPSDTKGNSIAFTSDREGNWEAYVMGLDGAGVKNLSDSPNSNDGLPTISPDGNWVAFVSDRSGQWAVWVVPVAGGPAQELFDLPGDNPWGDGERAWTNERISWGP